MSGGEATPVTVAGVVAELGSRRDEEALRGMARYGIEVDRAYGWSVPEVRARVVWSLDEINPSRSIHCRSSYYHHKHGRHKHDH